jgi:hypothetical protein
MYILRGMDILYYSTNCTHCQKLLQYLAKNGLSTKMNFLTVDRRTVDQASGQTYLLLDRGTKVLLPPNVDSVPSLVLVSQNYRVVTGNDIYGYLTPKLQNMNDAATKNNGEPMGYQMGLGDVVSEKFTDYGMSPEELSTKGRGGSRQMHNYVSPKNDMFSIPTPSDDYKADKIGEIDMESLQQKRNAEIANATKNMPIIEINHQNYRVPAPRGPPPTHALTEHGSTRGPPPVPLQIEYQQHPGQNGPPKQLPAHYFTHTPQQSINQMPQQQMQYGRPPAYPNQNFQRGGYPNAYPNAYLVNI